MKPITQEEFDLINRIQKDILDMVGQLMTGQNYELSFTEALNLIIRPINGYFQFVETEWQAVHKYDEMLRSMKASD